MFRQRQLFLPGEAEAQQVVAAAHDVGFEQPGQLAADFVPELLVVEGLEGLRSNRSLASASKR